MKLAAARSRHRRAQVWRGVAWRGRAWSGVARQGGRWNHNTLSLGYRDSQYHNRIAIGYVGEDDIEADTWYRADKSGRLVKA